MFISFTRIATGLWLCLVADQALAQGGPPLITDDPDTPGDGHWEVNIGATGQTSQANTTGDLIHVDANYGLGDRIQLKYETGESYDREGSSHAYGLGDSLTGVKIRFFETGTETEGVRFSIYPQVETRGPVGSSNPSLTTAHTLYYLPVEVKGGFGPLAIAADLGREIEASTGETGWFGGVAAGYTPVEHVELIAELHDQTNATFPWQGRLYQGGARLEANEGLAFMFAAGQLQSSNPQRLYTIGYLGIRVTL